MAELKSIHISTILFIDENGNSFVIDKIINEKINLEGVKIITDRGEFELNLALDKTGDYQIILQGFEV